MEGITQLRDESLTAVIAQLREKDVDISIAPTSGVSASAEPPFVDAIVNEVLVMVLTKYRVPAVNPANTSPLNMISSSTAAFNAPSYISAVDVDMTTNASDDRNAAMVPVTSNFGPPNESAAPPRVAAIVNDVVDSLALM